MTPPTEGGDLICENHPDRAATCAVYAPAPPRNVYLCVECAERVRTILGDR